MLVKYVFTIQRKTVHRLVVKGIFYSRISSQFGITTRKVDRQLNYVKLQTVRTNGDLYFENPKIGRTLNQQAHI